jgi:hypothetical protein
MVIRVGIQGGSILSSEDYSLFGYPAESERELQPLWKHSSGKSSEHANSSESKIEDRVLEGWCEFVEGLISEGCSGRLCHFGGCCFLFADPLMYASCPSRIEKLSELKRLKGQT